MSALQCATSMDNLRPYMALAAFIAQGSPEKAVSMLHTMGEAARNACLAVLAHRFMWPHLETLSAQLLPSGSDPLQGAAFVRQAACILEHGHTPALDIVSEMSSVYPTESMLLLSHLYTIDILWEQPDNLLVEILQAVDPDDLALVLSAETEPVRQKVFALCDVSVGQALTHRWKEQADDDFMSTCMPMLLPRARQRLLCVLRDAGHTVSLQVSPDRLFNPQYHPCPVPHHEQAIMHHLNTEALLLRMREVTHRNMALIIYSLHAEAAERLTSLCSPRTRDQLQEEILDMPRITFAIILDAWREWEQAR